jgi:hypothetical protein
MLPLEQDMQPRTAKSFPLLRQLTQSFPYAIITIGLRLVTVARHRNIYQKTSFPFTQPKAFPDIRRRQAFGLGL